MRVRVPILTVSSLSGKSKETAVLKVTPRASTARDRDRDGSLRTSLHKLGADRQGGGNTH